MNTTGGPEFQHCYYPDGQLSGCDDTYKCRLLLCDVHVVQDADAIKEAAGQQVRAKGTAGPGQLETLWRIVAHDLLTSSHERKSLAFQLFTILLPNLS